MVPYDSFAPPQDGVTVIDAQKPRFFKFGWVVMVCSAKRELYEVSSCACHLLKPKVQVSASVRQHLPVYHAARVQGRLLPGRMHLCSMWNLLPSQAYHLHFVMHDSKGLTCCKKHACGCV